MRLLPLKFRPEFRLLTYYPVSPPDALCASFRFARFGRSRIRLKNIFVENIGFVWLSSANRKDGQFA